MTTGSAPVMVFDLDDTLYQERDYVISGIKAVAGQVERLFEVDYAAQLLQLYESGEKDFLGAACTLLNLPGSIKESLLWTYRLHEPNIRLSADARETIDALQSLAIPIAVLTDTAVEMPAARFQGRIHLRRQFDEHAVGLRRRHQRKAQRAQSCREHLGLAVRVCGMPQPRTIAEHRHPLRRGEAHL